MACISYPGSMRPRKTGVSVCLRPLTRRSLPKNRIFADVGFIVERLKLALLIEGKNSVLFVLNVIDKQNTVCVVDFMLDNTCQKALGFKTDFFTLEVESFDANFGVSGDVAIDFIDAETALVVENYLTFSLNDFGVDKCGKLAD